MVHTQVGGRARRIVRFYFSLLIMTKGRFHSPKFWSLVRQKIGRWFAKKLVRDYQKIGQRSPKNWSLVRQKIGHSLLKFWSSFAKNLVIRQNFSHHSPKFWLFIRQSFGCSSAKVLVVHPPKFWFSPWLK
jgi:hypothetical protein